MLKERARSIALYLYIQPGRRIPELQLGTLGSFMPQHAIGLKKAKIAGQYVLHKVQRYGYEVTS